MPTPKHNMHIPKDVHDKLALKCRRVGTDMTAILRRTFADFLDPESGFEVTAGEVTKDNPRINPRVPDKVWNDVQARAREQQTTPTAVALTGYLRFLDEDDELSAERLSTRLTAHAGSHDLSGMPGQRRGASRQ